MDKRSQSKDLNEASLTEAMIEYARAIKVEQREHIIRTEIWGTYKCQDLLMRATQDRGGLSAIFKHKLALRALIVGPAVAGSALGWIPGLDPESQVAALVQPSAQLALQRERQLELASRRPKSGPKPAE